MGRWEERLDGWILQPLLGGQDYYLYVYTRMGGTIIDNRVPAKIKEKPKRKGDSSRTYKKTKHRRLIKSI